MGEVPDQRIGIVHGDYISFAISFVNFITILPRSTGQSRSIHLGETVLYITDIANPWVSGTALFFISNRSVGKRGNTSSVVGHCIL
jgi:hypothetical protein